MPKTHGAGLVVEPVDTDENVLQQLIASTKRIEAGLAGVLELVEGLDDRLATLNRRLPGTGAK